MILEVLVPIILGICGNSFVSVTLRVLVVLILL